MTVTQRLPGGTYYPRVEGFRAFREIEDMEGIAKVQDAFCESFYRVAKPLALPDRDTSDAALEIEVFSRRATANIIRGIRLALYRKGLNSNTILPHTLEEVELRAGQKRRLPITEQVDKFAVSDPIDKTGTRVVSLRLPYSSAIDEDRYHIHNALSGAWIMPPDVEIVGLSFPIAELHGDTSATDVIESRALWPAAIPLSPLQFEA